MNNNIYDEQKHSDDMASQLSQKSIQTFEQYDNKIIIQLHTQLTKLKKVYDFQTRCIIFPLGSDDSDLQNYTFNIFNQFLNQNLSFV
ncbi:unnamed protein product [Paramecium sonneborni]|uniref:Uncharacterized protein n=1 Tax=Paramecium sonneborni TaxID=65129 RepID=A0A8S1RTS6_9CILI|nr:unnamed protein product [Paramecium sonneborni]